jgi:capsid protein
VIHFGYFDSFDQVRGVSPLTSAIAQFQDVLEVSDYARAKAKITQLFALAITREVADFDDETDDGGGGYSVDFGKGPVKLELDPGDKADFLESKHPSTEFQSFMQVTLQAALKALDIPWSFYDEAYTNFFGSKAALMQYQQSCQSKRDDLRELLDRITVWRMSQWVANGTLQLPGGMTVNDLSWDWVPAGVPWWDSSKEVAGDLEAINGGLRTRTEIRRERFGDDWKDVIRKLAEEQAFMDEVGVSVTTKAPQPNLPQEEPTPDVDPAADEGTEDIDKEDGGEGTNDPGIE